MDGKLISWVIIVLGLSGHQVVKTWQTRYTLHWNDRRHRRTAHPGIYNETYQEITDRSVT